MKAEAKSLRFLGEDPRKLEVPFFQRQYVWRKENWEELITNLIETDGAPFLGSIIIKLTNDRNPSRGLIIDGQQRLTTLTILAKAIYDTLDGQKKEDIRQNLSNFLFFVINAADNCLRDGTVKIQHSMIDKKDYEYVICSGMKDEIQIDLSQISESSSNILQCYKYFMEYLKGLSEAQIIKLYNKIFDHESRMLVVITLESDNENEQAIFDTINRAGVHLSVADIIKNNIFQKAMDLSKTDQERIEVIELYNNTWAKIFLSEENTRKWDSERSFGNVKKTNLEFLLYCIILIKNNEFVKDRDLTAAYKQYTETLTTINDIKKFIAEIYDYAVIFKKYIIDFNEKLSSQDEKPYIASNDVLKKLLLILYSYKVQMFYPYIINLIKDNEQYIDNSDTWSITDNELITKLNKLEEFVVKNRIAKASTSSYVEKCYNLIHNPNTTLDFDDTKVRMGIQDIRPDAARLLLFILELNRRKNIDEKSLQYNYTLEHIIPIDFKDSWKNVPVVEGNTILTGDEAFLTRSKAVKSLGNMILLSQSLNASIKNAEFSKKVNSDNNTTSYRNNSTLLLTKELVNQFDASAEGKIWNENRIKERESKLYNEILTLWK